MCDRIVATEAVVRQVVPTGATLMRVGHAGAAMGRARAIVAVPAKDEERRIGSCLESLAVAQARAKADVLVLVNNTSDATFERALGFGAALDLTLTVVEVRLPPGRDHAGEARGLALDAAVGRVPEGGTLVTTDADSRVAPDWIAANCAELARGAALVCGLIEMEPADAEALPTAVKAASVLETRYLALMRRLEDLIDPDPWNPLPHHGGCGGASIATTSAWYRAVGGLPRVPCSEDRALLARFREHDLPVVFSEAARVVVSGRTTGRTPGGMADAVATRITDPDSPIDSFGEPARDWQARLACRARARMLHRSHTGLLPLCRELGLSPAATRAACAETFFGAAWSRIEAASRYRSRRPLRPSQLNLEIARLETLIAAGEAEIELSANPVMPTPLRRSA